MSSKQVELLACHQCGKIFPIPVWRLKEEGRGKFCSPVCSQKYPISEETRIKMRVSHKGERASMFGKHHTEEANAKNRTAHIGKRQSAEAKAKKSTASKAMWEDSTFRAKASQKSKEMWQRPEFLARMSKVHKELWLDPEFRAMMAVADSGSAKRRWQNPEYRKHQIEAQIKKWERPEYVAKMMASLHRSPTKPEEQLEGILAKHFPEFKYNGDGRLGVTLGRLTPDFVNINGKKEVIEVFGDYYHSPEIIKARWQGSELGKIMVYNSLGWKCLVIWEHEVKQLSESEVVEKVNQFFSKRRGCATVHPG